MDFHPQPKPEPRKRTKGRQQRQAAKVVKSVRAQCVSRDGYCRIQQDWLRSPDPSPLARECTHIAFPSEWAHMHVKRRSQTRGLPPEIRHTTKDSLMLCSRHHAEYDNKAKPRLFITALTRKGADGPLKFTRAKS